jgi:hypothetical protein
MTIDKWCKFYKIPLNYFVHHYKEVIPSMIIIKKNYQWIIDESLNINDDKSNNDIPINFIYENFNKYFIVIK